MAQLVGMEECQKRIIAMVRESKEKAGLPSDLTFKALVGILFLVFVSNFGDFVIVCLFC